MIYLLLFNVDSNKHNVATNETHGICVSSDVTEHADPESVLKQAETITNKDSLPVFDQAVAVVSNMSNKTGMTMCRTVVTLTA